MRQESFAALLALGAAPALAAFPWPLVPFVKRSEASTWTPAKATDAAVDGNVDFKKGHHAPRPTEAPALGRMELMKRLDGYSMGGNTCGFVNSASSDAYTCVNKQASCRNDGTYMGCCDDPGCSVLKTKCLNYQQSVAKSCASPADYHTVCCSEALAPSCFTWVFSTTATPGSTFTLYGCDVKSGVGTLLDHPPAFTKPGNTIPTYTPSSARSSSRSSSSTSRTPTPTPDEEGGTNVAAIVGGTVGGIAAIGAAGLLGFFLIIRRRKAAADTPPPGANPAAPLMAQHMSYPPASPGTTLYPNSPGGFYQPQPQQQVYQDVQTYPPQGYDPNYNPQLYQQPQGYAPQGYNQYQAVPAPYPVGVAPGTIAPQQYAPTGVLPGQTQETVVARKEGDVLTHPPTELESVNPLGLHGNRAELH